MTKEYDSTLCEVCENAVPSKTRGCEWSRNFEPVPGWEATQTVNNGIPSFKVIACPKHIPEDLKAREDAFKRRMFQYRIEELRKEYKKLPKKNATFQYRAP